MPSGVETETARDRGRELPILDPANQCGQRLHTMTEDTSTSPTTPNRRHFLEVLGATGTATVLPFSRGATAEESGRAYEIRPFSVTSFDGIELRGHLHLPKDVGRPLAPVLNLSPYWNTSLRNSSDDPSGPACTQQGTSSGSHVCAPSWLQPLIENGFAHAAVNPRGTGISDGCLGHGNAQDIRDARAVVEALAEPAWSNGKVGMYGPSFDGWTQSLALVADPPSLEAVVPISSVIDLWSVFTFTGAAKGVGGFYAPAWDALTSLVTTPPQPDHVDCPDRANDWYASVDLAVTGNKTPWWQARDYLAHIAESSVPMFVANGLGPGEGHILQVEGLYEARKPNTTRMLLGQWGHGTPPLDGWMDRVLDWFDHYLRDGPRTVNPGVVRYQDDAGGWHETDTWPPAADRTSLYLSEETLVADGEEVTPSKQRFQSEVTSPGLTVEDCGPQQALYASPPLREEVLLAGNFTIETTLTSTMSGGNFEASLFHTPGDGVCPDSNAEWFTYALADLRHWKTPGNARPFPINEPTPVTFESIPFAATLPAGHRLVLAIGGGSTALYPDPRKPVLTVSTGQDIPGSVTLPVVAGDLAFATHTDDAAQSEIIP